WRKMNSTAAHLQRRARHLRTKYVARKKVTLELRIPEGISLRGRCVREPYARRCNSGPQAHEAVSRLHATADLRPHVNSELEAESSGDESIKEVRELVHEILGGELE